MKKIITIVLVLLCAETIQAQVNPGTNPNGPKMKFETEMIDYGTIEHYGNGEREFKFKNTGKEPLIISNAVTGCGCLVASFSKEPIKPGASGVIKVHYSTDRVGHFEKQITITSNDNDRPVLVLKIRGDVLPSAPVKQDSVSTALSK